MTGWRGPPTDARDKVASREDAFDICRTHLNALSGASDLDLRDRRKMIREPDLSADCTRDCYFPKLVIVFFLTAKGRFHVRNCRSCPEAPDDGHQ